MDCGRTNLGEKRERMAQIVRRAREKAGDGRTLLLIPADTDGCGDDNDFL